MTAKSLKAKLLAMVLAVTVMTGLLSTVRVSAKSEESGAVDGIAVTARSTISASMASGTTSANYYNPYVTCSASGAYVARNNATGEYYSPNSSNTAISSAVISFLAPSGYQSVSITCSHSATNGSQTWTTTTEAYYN